MTSDLVFLVYVDIGIVFLLIGRTDASRIADALTAWARGGTGRILRVDGGIGRPAYRQAGALAVGQPLPARQPEPQCWNWQTGWT